MHQKIFWGGGVFLAAALVSLTTGCCGLLSKGDDGASGTTARTAQAARPVEFAGTYKLQADVFTCELTIEKTKKNIYSLFKRSEDIVGVIHELGVEKSGYLGIGGPGADDGIGIFQKQDSELSGLWTTNEGKYVFGELSSKAKMLEVSTKDLRGSYKVEGASDDGEESYRGTMTLEPLEDTWLVSVEYDDGTIDKGVGLAVDNVLVTGIAEEGSKIITVFVIKGDNLEGNWVYSYHDEKKGSDVMVSGWEKGTKE